MMIRKKGVMLKSNRSNSASNLIGSNRNFLKSKASQSEVITTVLLVLIGIVAVGLLSAFVIGFVRNNLKSSDCLGLQGEVSINTAEAITFFNLTSNVSFVVIERSQKDFNLSGINVVLENDRSSKMYKIREGTDTKICVVTDGMDCNLSASTSINLPGTSNPKVTYMINSASDFTSPVTKISIVPVLKGEVACNEAMDEKAMPTYP